MHDFTSALYLGMYHQSISLSPWESFTTGVPAALKEPKESYQAARKIAEMQGCDDGMLAPSTLHTFLDLFCILSRKGGIIFIDEGAYPIARWGAEHAILRGVIVKHFPHNDPVALAKMIRKGTGLCRRPLIVSDGFCPSCGKPAPVSDYLSIAEAFGGYLILDDTQAMGILGHSPSKDNPYGTGGGGILQWSRNTGNPHILVISSMAKAFGVPVAVLSASHKMIQRFKEKSAIRVHCSPPSNAAIHAAEHALVLNERYGDSLRLHLLKLVRYFRSLMKKAGFRIKGGVFPVQTIETSKSDDAVGLHDRLLDLGINTVLRSDRDSRQACISFIITTAHKPSDIDFLVNAISETKFNHPHAGQVHAHA